MATFRSSLAVLLVAVTLCTCQALVVVNKGSFSLICFVPPMCFPCLPCPRIECIRAPCVQPTCVCPELCRFIPGVVINSKANATLTVEVTEFPLAFLNVESGNYTYVVNKTDLKKIGFTSTVVVTGQSCGKGEQGIEALVFSSPEFYARFFAFKRICLMRGAQYGN